MPPSGVAVVDRYTQWLTRTVADTANRAIRSASVPVTFAYGTTHLSRDYAFNRRAAAAPERLIDGPDGKPPTIIPILEVRDAAGPMAILFGYAAHANVYGGAAHAAMVRDPSVVDPRMFAYHPDFPGVAAHALEERYPGATAFYMTGASGDLDLASPTPAAHDPTLVPGSEIAQATAEALPSLEPLGPISSSRYGAATLTYEITPSILAQAKLIANQLDNPWGRHAKVLLQEYVRDGSLASVRALPLSVWTFGNGPSALRLVTMAGEPLVHWSLTLRAGALGVPGRIWFVGYADDACCYVPSDTTIVYPGYETGWRADLGQNVTSGSALIYDLPARFAPGTIDEPILSTYRALVRRAVARRTP
jgi:hypothetical protein